MKIIRTTVVGSYSKPDYLDLPTWFDGNSTQYKPEDYSQYLQQHDPKELEKLLDKAISEIINEQIELGLDIITDGELRRENYIHYFCRHLEGINFEILTEKKTRDNKDKSLVPTIVGPIKLRSFASSTEWLPHKNCSVPVKITLPGPMTILDTIANNYYKDLKKASLDLSLAIRSEIINLVKLGCRHIQIDEPLMARKVKDALDYGIEHIEYCFKGLPEKQERIERTLHICCGYPNYLDQDDYAKADPHAYQNLANRLDKSNDFEILSIEDAEANNSLSLFKMFKKKTIQLGVIRSARSQIETIEEIEDRIRKILIQLGNDPQRLMVSPDCGLGMLPRKIAYQKLKNMVLATEKINSFL